MGRLMKFKISVLLVLMPLCAPTPARAISLHNDCATYQGFSELGIGMNYGAAVMAMGCDGEEYSRTQFGNDRLTVWIWRSKGYGFVMAHFKHGIIISKTQSGLRR